jgi:hypothetical protein
MILDMHQNQNFQNQNHIKNKTIPKPKLYQNQNFKTSFGFGACLFLEDENLSHPVTENVLMLIVYSFIFSRERENGQGEERKVSQKGLTDERYVSRAIYTCMRGEKRMKKRKNRKRWIRISVTHPILEGHPEQGMRNLPYSKLC